MLSGKLIFPAIERVVYGESAASALSDEAPRQDAQSVLLLVSHAMNRTMDEVAKVRASLGLRHGIDDPLR